MKRYEPDDLQRCGNREYCLKSHDSFKINEDTSLWHWKSRDIGGKSALDFLIKVRGMHIVDAVFFLSGENPSYTLNRKPAERKPFTLPPANTDTNLVQAYLENRGISPEVMESCIRQGILYESFPYHNAVFVGKDPAGVPKYATSRGIYLTKKGQKPFRRDAAGSDKTFCFCIPPKQNTQRVAVYEAAIEAMSHLSLEPDCDKYRLSLGGIYAPKPGEEERKNTKKPQALEGFLMTHPEVAEIEICTNNDHAGRYAAKQIGQAYRDRYQVIYSLPEREGEDYNDKLRRVIGSEQTKTQNCPVR